MEDFPKFMKEPLNRIGPGSQYTEDIEGYVFDGKDGSQVAFWTCHKDRISKEHSHKFDEYVVCVGGHYEVTMGGNKIKLDPGDELFIPEG
jgi:quercetin dioxygenase-like cupin family protein